MPAKFKKTLSVHDRLALLQNPARRGQLDEFAPQEGECYVLGTTSSHRRQLVEDIRPGAGHGRVGYGATVDLGATIIEESEIGAEAYVAAGAVVIRDVPARVLVAGVPAEIKKNR